MLGSMRSRSAFAAGILVGIVLGVVGLSLLLLNISVPQGPLLGL
jgi:hypothetical protein